MTTIDKMPVYISHKRVRALEIAGCENKPDGSARLYFAGDFEPIAIDPVLLIRYSPKPGDFFVVYEDGYESQSPRKAFLDGYTKAVPEGSAFTKVDPADGPLMIVPKKDYWFHPDPIVANAYATVNTVPEIDMTEPVRRWSHRDTPVTVWAIAVAAVIFVIIATWLFPPS